VWHLRRYSRRDALKRHTDAFRDHVPAPPGPPAQAPGNATLQPDLSTAVFPSPEPSLPELAPINEPWTNHAVPAVETEAQFLPSDELGAAMLLGVNTSPAKALRLCLDQWSVPGLEFLPSGEFPSYGFTVEQRFVTRCPDECNSFSLSVV
jgi:hypothetical protein